MSYDLSEIHSRIAFYKPLLEESNMLSRAEELFRKCNEGSYISPNFKFYLAMECLKAVGYTISGTPENQGVLI